MIKDQELIPKQRSVCMPGGIQQHNAQVQGQKSPGSTTPDQTPGRMARSKSHSQLRELHAEGEEGEPEVAAKSFTSTGTGEGSSDWGATQNQEQVSKSKTKQHLNVRLTLG